jgi:hypothetical protein
MTDELPRIASVAVIGPTTIGVKWRDGASDRVDLAGWINTGGGVLSALGDPALFSAAKVDEFGASVMWGEDDDLAIDAFHLEQLAAEQRPFGKDDAAAWQERMGLSNQEAADFFRVALSTWNSYKAGANIPGVVAMLCRAAQRDPILMQAHYRPRKAGRPRKAAEAF